MSHHFLILWLLATSLCSAQTPRLNPNPPEEEETNPLPPKRKIIIEDEPPPPVQVPRGCYYVRMEDVARAAVDTRPAGLKRLLQKYVIAFDRLTESNGTILRICPVPLYRDAKFPKPFGVFLLNDADEPQSVRAIDPGAMRELECYEEMILKEADALLQPSRDPDQGDAMERAAVAEQLIAAAGLFLDGARDQSKRRGKEWDAIKKTLFDRLAMVRLVRLKLAAQNSDWPTVRSLGSRMMNLYPNNAKLQEEVFTVRLTEALRAAASDQLADLERAKILLNEFESTFPESKNESAAQVRTALDQQAAALFKRAEAALRGDQKDAPRLLRTLEAIHPNHPGLRDLLGQLKAGYSVLNVGVSRMPEQMSPLTATSESEKMAVELMFESLLETLPDDEGGQRYRPMLALTLPTVGGTVRDFRLVRPVDWAGLPREYADASDVARTLKLYKTDYRHTWAAASTEWLSEQTRIDDPAAIHFTFNGGHPRPLSCFNFKLLPTRWLQAQGMKLDDPRFGQHPYGTGPYRIDVTGGKAVFVANPSYGRRPGRLGQPFIPEIRFIDWTKLPNPVSYFKDERLHLIPDVPTEQLKLFESPSSELRGRAEVVTSRFDRRIWILAMNHRRPALRSVPLRRAIAQSIDRDDILSQCFRFGNPQFHKALTGAFPVQSWAVPPQAAPLLDRDLALAKAGDHNRSNPATILRLLVPEQDSRAVKACNLIKKQVETVCATADGRISIVVDPKPAADFDRLVYREQNYDLAYLPFDYPDDVYPFGLGALLDPTASAAGGRNIFGYLDRQSNTAPEDETLGRQLIEIRRYADFAGRLIPQTHDLHRRFIDAMPFVPLWQLDRHMVISTRLKIAFDERQKPVNARDLPLTVFSGVSRWRFD